MNINKPPREFTEREYVIAAYFSKTSINELKKLKLIPVTFSEMDNFEYHTYFIMNGMNRIMLACEENTIYYYSRVSEAKNFAVYLLVMAYLYPDKRFFINTICSNLDSWLSKNASLHSNMIDMERRYRNIVAEYISGLPQPNVSNFNIRKINREMSKYKGKAWMEDNNLVLRFNKIKVGNEIEGYINYKYIILYFNMEDMDDFNSYRVKYGFNKFEYDTELNIPALEYLHPHLGRNICLGNRDEDWEIYTESLSFDFIIATIYESLTNYNPDNPYINVSTIKNILKVLGNVYKNYEKMNPASTPEEIATHIFENTLRCKSCGSFIEDEQQCGGPDCRCNPNADINCDICGSTLECGDWIDRYHGYEWRCPEPSCRRHQEQHQETSTDDEELDELLEEAVGATPERITLTDATISGDGSTFPTEAIPGERHFQILPIGTSTVCRVCGLEMRVQQDARIPYVELPAGTYQTYYCGRRAEGGCSDSISSIWQMAYNEDTNTLYNLYPYHYGSVFDAAIQRRNAAEVVQRLRTNDLL